MSDFRRYLDVDGSPRMPIGEPDPPFAARPVPPEWRSPRMQAALARPDLHPDTEESPAAVTAPDETPGTAARARRSPMTRAERDANGRFRSAADPREDRYQPVGTTAATGAFDVAEVLRRLDQAEAAKRRDARAWPRATVQIVVTIAVLAFLTVLAFLAVYAHTVGLW